MAIDRRSSRDPLSPEPTHSPFRSPAAPSRKVTPLERQALLPSPPSTVEAKQLHSGSKPLEALLTLQREVESGGTVAPLTTVSVTPAQYLRLLERIESIPAFKRFDYEPVKNRLTLHMTLPTHDAFTSLLSASISQELARLGGENESVQELTSKIRSVGSARVLLDDNVGQKSDEGRVQLRRQPDAQFQAKGALYPGVVIEVSYSQDGKKLDRIAKEYINYSDGNINAVICIDINNGTESTVSLWKVCFVPEGHGWHIDFNKTIDSQTFRTADGEAVNSEKCLTLQLHDFAPDSMCRDSPDIPMCIPFAELFNFLFEAEEMQKFRESAGVDAIQSTRNVIKRRLSSSSAEELHAHDETRFRDQERAVDNKAQDSDEDFQPQMTDTKQSRDHESRPRMAKRRA